ncbi:uncharacterized protein UTRI_10158 [Ustilago trichophora]|uniref:MaoC-like domain-containing protein n=1 Tax=Ustilago trichophora TaxID=86804 RepID=A0A5C3EC35_9BASI|nr:uncharacterized protein UTRI_10158 [Ustilago trichophora]
MFDVARCSSSELTRGVVQVGLGVGLSAAVYGMANLHFRSLCRYFFRKPRPEEDGCCKLDFAPSEIGWADRAFFVFCGVMWKAVKGVFGFRLDVKGRDEVELPRLEVRCPVVVDGEQRELYKRALRDGKEERGMGDLVEDFLLAALTNQLMLLLVVHPRLPISPLGAVNVRNRIEFHQQQRCSVQEDQPLTAHAYLGGKSSLGRVTKRGVEIDIHVDVSNASSPQALVLRQVITILAPCKTTNTLPTAPSQTHSDETFHTTGAIDMSSSAPSLWSRVCGDYNPIHVSSTLARLFGFRGKIAHGNHVVAKLLHLLPPGEQIAGQKGGAWWLEMQFKRPMVLPIRLTAQSSGSKDETRWRYIGDKDDKVYVSGSFGRL